MMATVLDSYDVIIVGAGPAGCSAATFLSASGFEVLLLDRAFFPRDKVCGDGLSASSLALFDRMGVTAKIEAAEPFWIDSILVSTPKGEVIKRRNPPVEGLRDYGYVFPRKELDSILFDHARGLSGVTAIEGAKVTGLLRDAGRITGVTAIIDGEQRALRGAFILGADGVHSVVARELGRDNHDAKHRPQCIRAYFEGVEGLEHTIEIHYDPVILPGYGWIFPTGPTTANIGVGSERASAVTGRTTNLRELFHTFVTRNSFAQKKLRNATMVPRSLRGCPETFGSFPGKRAVANVLLLGDAASFVDPLTGEGIYPALKSGESAARAIATGLHDRSRTSEVGRIYESLWRREFWLDEYLPAYLLQRLLAKPAIADRALARAVKDPKLARLLVAIIGHRVPKSAALLGRHSHLLHG